MASNNVYVLSQAKSTDDTYLRRSLIGSFGFRVAWSNWLDEIHLNLNDNEMIARYQLRCRRSLMTVYRVSATQQKDNDLVIRYRTRQSCLHRRRMMAHSNEFKTELTAPHNNT